ncbi:hypothetical protein D3C71_1076070 [compost metagenome]
MLMNEFEEKIEGLTVAARLLGYTIVCTWIEAHVINIYRESDSCIIGVDYNYNDKYKVYKKKNEYKEREFSDLNEALRIFGEWL